MITTIKIENYKSIDSLTLELGRFNVLIGENGAGKSNILEAITLAGAAAANKLDNEFLSSRGIRVTEPGFMRSAFAGASETADIRVEVSDSERHSITYELANDNAKYSKWRRSVKSISFTEIQRSVFEVLFRQGMKINSEDPQLLDLLNNVMSSPESAFGAICDFIIYSPENSALRMPYREGQIEPLGINGEGVLKLLSYLQRESKYAETLQGIQQHLKLLGWFDSLKVVSEGPGFSRMEIGDRYLDESRRYFDQMSTNEGFLFLLFYYLLFMVDLTPRFFAIDNIDASLNPKLCEALTGQLATLAAAHDKQVILTTHNPAVLDGLNLNNDQQRLFVVSRNRAGKTRIERIERKHDTPGAPIRLSESFLRGALGGLPKGF